jgi:hypothetical protein
MNTVPLPPAAAMIASASSGVSAIGFSRNTCLPAAKAFSAASRCSRVGRQMSTASTSGSLIAASMSVVSCAPTLSATRAALSETRVATVFTRTRSPSAL